MVFTIRNVGTTSLTDLTVTDMVTEGNATVSGLSCDFSALGGPATGTTWAGPFESAETFDCTATLSGVSGFSTDVATVEATGTGPVSSSDPFVAFRDAPVTPVVSVGDFVWFDINRDGLQDGGEAGIGGVTLTLTGPDGGPVTDVFGDLVTTAITDVDGLYSFDDLPVLPSGEFYTVTVTDPVGFTPTTAEVDPVTGSSTGTATSGDLTSDGDRDPTLDFGFVTPVVSVGGSGGDDNDIVTGPTPPLAFTGTSLARTLAIGFILLLMGAFITMTSTRRRKVSSSQ